jgi:hypothetical protein
MVGDRTFRHEVLLYAGPDEFVGRVAPFVRGGVDAEGVRFADMATIGRNPGRIIAEWREFVCARGDGRALRGVDEGLYADRTPDERVEVHGQEALLNVALAGSPLWLVCPYDTAELSPVDSAD